MDEIDIEDAKRLQLEYNCLCMSGELGSLSHGRKRKLREANALCRKYDRLKEKLTMLQYFVGEVDHASGYVLEVM